MTIFCLFCSQEWGFRIPNVYILFEINKKTQENHNIFDIVVSIIRLSINPTNVILCQIAIRFLEPL
jgi:hypothetical protein